MPTGAGFVIYTEWYIYTNVFFFFIKTAITITKTKNNKFVCYSILLETFVFI